MEIKIAKKNNLDDIEKIEKECFTHPWSRDNIICEINRKGTICLVAYCNENVVGYVLMNVIVDEGYICNIAVLKNYRRRGISKALMNELIRLSIEKSLAFITLEVRSANSSAIDLYRKYSFEKVGERKNYYKDPVDSALLMTKYFR